MKADITRSTFRSTKHFRSVVMQQGRVHLDADWNESVDILSALDETTRVDTIGRHGVPKADAGFAVSVAPDGSDLLIGPGRIYVDGLLCELEAGAVDAVILAADRLEVERIVLDDRPLRPGDWLVVEDGSGVAAAQLVRITEVDGEARMIGLEPALSDPAIEGASIRRVASYTTQPDLPDPDRASAPGGGGPPSVALDDGTYLAYLDVWLRHVTALDDPTLQDPALGGLDTTTRMQTIAQVRLTRLGPDLISDCDLAPELPDAFVGSSESGDRPPSTGRLSARARPADEADELCEIPADARYQGLENQLYRVEVHDPGELGAATFKWSRENGSIAALWLGQDGDRLTVSSTGRDAELGFASGQLVELVDDTLELNGRPGTLVQLAAPPREDELTIDPAVPVQYADFSRTPKVRRWDNAALGTIATPAGDGFVPLENGLEVHFDAGWYNTGDYWLIPARTATRDVEWPVDPEGRPLARPPDGIAHHYARLALIEVAGGVPTAAHDCRAPFPSLTTITADDVAFDNAACEIPGAQTVQDALDALCESSTLRRHNKHLHGWGIVCGLRVTCGPDEEGQRQVVTVGDGYALDCEGNDLIVERAERLDLFRMIEERGGLDGLLDAGDGDVSLFMTSDVERGIVYDLERYDPDWDDRPNPLAGDLLNDVYRDCIKPIEDFLRRELGIGTPERRGKLAERQSILASLAAQVLNPNASQTIYLSRREHEIVVRFYEDLRALLQSETFCAMFDDAAPFPDYPEELPEDMDTIFGIGHHQRLRIRPGSREAWTVGGGLDPIRSTSFVNRYDLEGRELLERLAPLAGTAVEEGEPDSGAGAITDIAFSPGGDRVYVVAPTRNGQNTLFRAGRIERRGVSWGELVTICDTKLLTLATTRADPNHVYAVGSRTGLYKIDPDAVDPSMAAILAFPSSGHLVMTEDGRGYATSIQEGATADVPTYDRIVGFTVAAPATISLDVTLPRSGGDDLAVGSGAGRGRRADRAETLYVVTGTRTGTSKQLLAYDAATGEPRATRGGAVALGVADSPVSLHAQPATGMLLVVSEDDCLVELVDMSSHELVADQAIPVQVGPVSAGSTDEPGFAYVLNYWSDTITVIPASQLRPGAEFPLAVLARYRREIIHAFRDLLAGFLQYLKDCLCDHLLVDCPVCDGDERIYLATVSIRDRMVYKVCNFSRRKYVKSFPTVDYWLSIVPIMPMIQRAVEEFCCMVLPDIFGRQTVPEYDPAAERRAPMVRYSTARSNVDLARDANIASKFTDVRTRTTLAAGLIGRAGRRSLTDAIAEPAVRIGNLVDRPADDVEAALADRGVRVARAADEHEDLPTLLGDLLGLLRTPRRGDEVTLHEEEGRVRYINVAARRTERRPDASPEVEELSKAVVARDADIAALRSEVERLQASQAAAVPATGEQRIAALEAELQELRGLRDQVTALLEADRPSKPSGTRATAKPKSTSATAKPRARRKPPSA
ncbi:MAG TPA: DUF6519 domain-containing protein [Clostridia bacterium]|nr:DUF6519 domain-containing protein [Clostridia bacterium]